MKMTSWAHKLGNITQEFPHIEKGANGHTMTRHRHTLISF